MFSTHTQKKWELVKKKERETASFKSIGYVFWKLDYKAENTLRKPAMVICPVFETINETQVDKSIFNLSAMEF